MSDPDFTSRSAQRWQRISACFEQALETPLAERTHFVELSLADDPESCREVIEMLNASSNLGMLDGDARELFSDLSSDSDETALPTGTTVGAYRLAERVGRGGMGDVYRAHRVDGVFEQQVAIKMLRGGLWGDTLVRRFEMERRILARLTHPDIVGIIDGGTSENSRPYLVMPYVDGQPITEYCEKNQLGLDARLRLFMRVANAVQHAHTRLIVHRDIKPSNIFVTNEGEVRLLDFGIAKLLNADADTTAEVARSTVRLFTPEYSAPEQLAGQSITAATDVHALGLLLYQLVCNERPNRMPGRPLRELEHAILNVDPPAPSTIESGYAWRARVRGDLDLIILKALRKEPDRRYATAAQFADDVGRFMAGMPVQAVKGSAAYSARRFVQRHRAGVITSAALALTLAGIALLTTVQAHRLKIERDRVQREQIATNTVVNLLQSLFARSNPNVFSGGDTLRVAQLLDVGELMVDSLSSQPLVQARMWRSLGNMHESRGRIDKAKDLLWRAYQRYQTSVGADSLDVIATLHEYARVVGYYEGREAAAPLFRQTVERMRRVVPDTSSDLRIAERELSQSLEDAEARAAELEKLAGKSHALANAADSIARASDLNALAVEKYGTGDYPTALSLFTEVLRILTATLPPAHPNRLLLMGNVGATRDRLGDYVGADAMLRELVKERRRASPVVPIPLAVALEYLAITSAHRGYLVDADTLMREVLALRSGNIPYNHIDVVRGLQNRAMIATARGRHADAVALADTARQLALSSRILTTPDQYSVRIRRLQTLIEAGKLPQADREATEIRPLVQREFNETHPMWVAFAMNQGVLALLHSNWTEAAAAFASAETGLKQRMPSTHPDVAGAACGRGIALREIGGSNEGPQLIGAHCTRYRQYGLASPAILARLN